MKFPSKILHCPDAHDGHHSCTSDRLFCNSRNRRSRSLKGDSKKHPCSLRRTKDNLFKFRYDIFICRKSILRADVLGLLIKIFKKKYVPKFRSLYLYLGTVSISAHSCSTFLHQESVLHRLASLIFLWLLPLHCTSLSFPFCDLIGLFLTSGRGWASNVLARGLSPLLNIQITILPSLLGSTEALS